MKIIKDNYHKVLGFIKCSSCGSVLRIDNTDRYWEVRGGKTVFFYTCAACNHKQYFETKQLMSKKKALAEDKRG